MGFLHEILFEKYITINTYLFRAFPMVSSLIGPQYHDDQFWKFAESADAGDSNDFSVAMVPTFADDFEVSTWLM